MVVWGRLGMGRVWVVGAGNGSGDGHGGANGRSGLGAWRGFPANSINKIPCACRF